MADNDPGYGLATTTSPARRASTGFLPVAWPLLVLLVVGSVIPVLLAKHYGALDIPRSDGWSYTRTLFTWHRTGHWDFNNWVSMTLIGQVLAATPVLIVFGYSVLAVNIAVAALGFVALVSLWRLGMLFGLSRWESAFVAIMTAATPIWGPLAPTFMTDVPAFAFEMFALVVACVALRRSPVSLPLLGTSIALGFAGVSIRQYGAIPLLAIFATAAWRFWSTHDRRRMRALFVMGAITAISVLVLLAWWRTVPRGKSLGPTLPTSSSLKMAYLNGAGFLRLAGIMLLPALLVAHPVEIVRRALRTDRRSSLTAVGISVFFMLTGYVPKRPFVGNYFARRGVLGDDIILPGVRPLIMPNWAFDVLVAIGTVSALVLVLATIPWLTETVDRVRHRRFEPGDPLVVLVALTVAGFAVGYELAMASGLPIFDRYALPALPLGALLLLRSTTRLRGLDPAPPRATQPRNRLAGVAALTVLGLIGAAYTAESASFDGTRWKVAQMAVADGYSTIQIDAGYEWVGWYRGDGPLTASTDAARQKLRAGYYLGLCVSVLVDADPHKLPPHVIAQAWSRAPTRRPALFVAYANDRACAPKRVANGP